MPDVPFEKWNREHWEEYLSMVPTYRLMQELVHRSQPLLLSSLSEGDTGDGTVETFDSGHDPERMMLMYLALGHHLWEEYGAEEI